MNDHTTHPAPKEIPYGYCHCGCGQKTNIAQSSDKTLGYIRGEPVRFLPGHNARLNKTRTLADRLWSRTDRPSPDSCWIWKGAKSKLGYGVIGRGGKDRRNTLTHRAAYELHYGPIPKGKVIDHLCHNPSCCNPRHLEAVTQRENTLRGKAPLIKLHNEKRCARGHLLTPENTYGRRRRCRICDLDYQHKAYVRKSTRPPRNKLTELDVLDIRRRASKGEVQKELARSFGVAETTISAIVRRKSWKHLFP